MRYVRTSYRQLLPIFTFDIVNLIFKRCRFYCSRIIFYIFMFVLCLANFGERGSGAGPPFLDISSPPLTQSWIRFSIPIVPVYKNFSRLSLTLHSSVSSFYGQLNRKTRITVKQSPVLSNVSRANDEPLKMEMLNLWNGEGSCAPSAVPRYNLRNPRMSD